MTPAPTQPPPALLDCAALPLGGVPTVPVAGPVAADAWLAAMGDLAALKGRVARLWAQIPPHERTKAFGRWLTVQRKARASQGRAAP